MPAVLLALHTYFPDMFLVRLLSLSVPSFSFCIGAKKTSDPGEVLVHRYSGTGLPAWDLQLKVTFPFSTGFPTILHTGDDGGTFTSSVSSPLRAAPPGMMTWQTYSPESDSLVSLMKTDTLELGMV